MGTFAELQGRGQGMTFGGLKPRAWRAGARAYNGGLGAEPPAEVQGAEPPVGG